jgi:hypothetical protein
MYTDSLHVILIEHNKWVSIPRHIRFDKRKLLISIHFRVYTGHECSRYHAECLLSKTIQKLFTLIKFNELKTNHDFMSNCFPLDYEKKHAWYIRIDRAIFVYMYIFLCHQIILSLLAYIKLFKLLNIFF